MLVVDEAVKHYAVGQEMVRAIDGVSLSVSAGEMLALQGPSGSGKTTLLLMAAGVLRADAGSVHYRGRDLGTLNDAQAAQYRLADVGVIWQHAHLMPHVPAIENAATKLVLGGVALPEARDRAAVWLDRVGLAERKWRTPQELSGGERQRVSIARALAGEPRLILADEPTANLDSHRSAEVVGLLREIAREQGAAVLLVTHDSNAAASADRSLVLRDGRVRPAAEQAPAA